MKSEPVELEMELDARQLVKGVTVNVTIKHTRAAFWRLRLAMPLLKLFKLVSGVKDVVADCRDYDIG